MGDAGVAIIVGHDLRDGGAVLEQDRRVVACQKSTPAVLGYLVQVAVGDDDAGSLLRGHYHRIVCAGVRRRGASGFAPGDKVFDDGAQFVLWQWRLALALVDDLQERSERFPGHALDPDVAGVGDQRVVPALALVDGAPKSGILPGAAASIAQSEAEGGEDFHQPQAGVVNGHHVAVVRTQRVVMAVADAAGRDQDVATACFQVAQSPTVSQVERSPLDWTPRNEGNMHPAARRLYHLGFVGERSVLGKRLRHLWQVDVDAGNLVRPDADICSRPSPPPPFDRAKMDRSVLQAMLEERVLAGRRTTAAFGTLADAGLVGPPQR